MSINKIFIVDDDRFYTHILESKLNNIGNFSIEKYYTGFECLDKAHTQPDIIFLDHHLGDTTGFEILKEIKSTYPNVHVVMLSGQKEMKVAISSLRFGATDYLLKDIDDNEKKLNEIIQDCAQISKVRAKVQGKMKRKLFSFFF